MFKQKDYQLNVLALLAISIVLFASFYVQIVQGELPCPLCILQRAGFVIVGLGLAQNVIVGVHARNYGLMVLGALVGGIAALRQVLLHIVPGTGDYGPPILGIHLYSWAFILFALVVIGVAVMLFVGNFNTKILAKEKPHGFALTVLIIFAILAFGNGVSTLAICGGGFCPDNPTTYEGLNALLGH